MTRNGDKDLLRLVDYLTRQPPSTKQGRFDDGAPEHGGSRGSRGDGQPRQVLRVPTGVAHGYKCISGPADIFYITSNVYDGQDEGRIPHDDPMIGYDWLKSVEIT